MSIEKEFAQNASIAAFFATAAPDEQHRLFAILKCDNSSVLKIFSTEIDNLFPSLTPAIPQLNLFEREILEQWNITPVGHPWPKPVRFPQITQDGSISQPVGTMPFYKVTGTEVHEVAVGPVHAGIIEPGHFRFQCHGEEVFFLEISLGYQHRGIERVLRTGPHIASVNMVETMAGDTTIGHTLTYCRCIETLAACQAPPRAQAIRGIALELERVANHIGDLGALAGDIGFLPTQSWCGRLRGDALNLTARICGNRFGRGLIRPGGVTWDIDATIISDMRGRIVSLLRDTTGAVTRLWETPSVMSRFEGTGVVSRETALQSGLVGPAARASGIARDIRTDFPDGIFRYCHIPVSTVETGDVFGRAYIRWLEIERSLDFIDEQLASMPGGPVAVPIKPCAPQSMAVALVEGWRGEICHTLITGPEGRFADYKVVDPSFHNWFGLAMAMRGQQISDFPLCNKSFSLSYCGHDL